MANIPLVFPPQQTLSIKETISTDLPGFIPHEEVILMGISDLFETQIGSISLSYCDKLKGSNENDKAIAAEIARWHNQIEYAKGCVADIENNALCKRMQLMLEKVGEDRKAITGDDCKAFEKDDEHKFILLDYNSQTFSVATADSDAIDQELRKTCESMEQLLSGNNCSWRSHLVYAVMLARITLDTTAVQKQIDQGIIIYSYFYLCFSCDCVVVYFWIVFWAKHITKPDAKIITSTL